MMKYLEVRNKFFDFMRTKDHVEIPNSPMVPENDPTVLFVNAGMFPLVPFLLGEKHPLGNRLFNIQRSLRTGDIDDVGDTSHCTAFEMLGFWSLNDYFKRDAIRNTIEFYVDVLGLDINHIYGSVYGGENGIPRDEESISVWKELFQERGISADVGKNGRIQAFVCDRKQEEKWRFDEKQNSWVGNKESKNWWGLPAGGPCGPCSEFFYDTGKEPCGDNCNINCDCGKFIEIGNDVLMQFNNINGEIKPLGRHNVDYGGGLERIVTMLQNVDSYFETDIYLPILSKVKELSKTENIKSQRILVDHIKSATWIVMDGVVPGRSEQGYILRRLIRRAVRHAKTLGIEGNFTRSIGEICIDQFSPIYPKLAEQKEEILNIIEEEENKFSKTLKDGLKYVGDVVNKILQERSEIKDKNTLLVFEDNSGSSFQLYETYGFPFEMFIEELNNKGIANNPEKIKENFNKALEAHQEKSRTAAKGFFKGGLADTSDMSKKYHTLQHLILAAMRQIIGEDIVQKGSNISPERLRFDFPSKEKLTDDQIRAIEKLVNEKIKEALPISFKELPKDEALKLVPFAMFTERYGDVVKVYTIGDSDKPFSREICNGPHVENTSEIGEFHITKQENLGAGLKRIKAIIKS